MNEIGICLIGAGRAGMIHGLNFLNRVPGAKMTAVCDAALEVAKNSAEQLGLTTYFTDYREALKLSEVDAVIVVSPTNLHKEIVVAAARAGKHVFCEKPMAIDEMQCQEMIDACEKAGVKLQIGFMRRHDASFKSAKTQLEAGEIGELVMVRSCTRGPSKPREWMYDIKKSNGILAELNSHDLDTVRWFSGSDYDTMNVVAGNFRSPEVSGEFPDYYDNVIISGTLKNGVQYIIDGAAYIKYGYDAQVELLGTRGVIRIGRSEADYSVRINNESGMVRPFISSWTELFRDAYLTEDISFVQAILNDTPTAVTGYDGLAAVRAVQRGNANIIGNY